MKKIITIALTILLLAAMMTLSVSATTGGLEAVGAAGAKPGDTVEVVLSVYGYSSVNSMGLSYKIPAGLQLTESQWLVEGTASDVNKPKSEAVWMTASAVDMTQKTPVFKLTFLVLDLPEGQNEATLEVEFTKLKVENNYQLISVDPMKAEVSIDAATGDMNGDGAVTDADAVYLLRYTLFGDDYPLQSPGDVNSDGVVTDADAVYLLRHTLFGDDYPLYP